MPGAIDFHCSVACAASREERLSEKIAMRMDGLPRWMHEGMAAQGYTSFVACQRARAVPKKKGRLGSQPLQQIACYLAAAARYFLMLNFSAESSSPVSSSDRQERKN